MTTNAFEFFYKYNLSFTSIYYLEGLEIFLQSLFFPIRYDLLHTGNDKNSCDIQQNTQRKHKKYKLVNGANKKSHIQEKQQKYK